MTLNNIGTGTVLLVTLVGCLLLVALGRVAWADVNWIVSAIVSSALTGGVVATRKRAPSAMIVPTLPPDTAVDENGSTYTVQNTNGGPAQRHIYGPDDVDEDSW